MMILKPLSVLALSALVLSAQAPIAPETPLVPSSWWTTPLKVVPMNARFTAWSGKMRGQDTNGVPVEPLRLMVEVPPGGSFRAKLDRPWDSPLELAVEQDAIWKLGIRVSKTDQRFSNSRKELRTARVSVSQATQARVGKETESGDFIINPGPWPYRVEIIRDWDIEAWRKARQAEAPRPESLRAVAAEALVPVHVASRPAAAKDPAQQGSAEVIVVLDAQGKPWAVHPGAGHPATVALLTEWAWQLAFTPGKGLPAEGAVKLPLRLNF